MIRACPVLDNSKKRTARWRPPRTAREQAGLDHPLRHPHDGCLNGRLRRPLVRGRIDAAGKPDPCLASARRSPAGRQGPVGQRRCRRVNPQVRAVDRLAVSAAVSTLIAAELSLRRLSKRLPKAANVSGPAPLPTPSSSRPPLSASSTAASSATRGGSSSGSVTTAVPSRMRLVRSATAARSGKGDGGQEREGRRRPPADASK